MRPRDRVLTALRRQVPDRVPVFMRMTPPVLAALKPRTGFDSPEEYFDFEIRDVAFQPTRRPNDYRHYFADVAGADGLEISEWGVGRLPGSLYHFRKITSPMRHFTCLAKRILDSGADGIMCPMINTAAEARQFVSYCRYAPLGIRGYATTICRHTSYGFHREEYFRRIHEDLAIMVQIETREAVDNTAAIAAVDGVNVVFIGPMDLSKSLGFPGEVTHPVVQDALRQAEEAIRKSGKIMGTMLVPGFELGALCERGYDFIITGADIGILRSGMENQVKGLLEAAKKSGRR